MSWIRVRLLESTPAKNWEETREAYGTRLKRCCEDVNENLKVDDFAGLSQSALKLCMKGRVAA